MTEKEKFEKDVFEFWKEATLNSRGYMALCDFILADRKATAEKIVNPIKVIKGLLSSKGHWGNGVTEAEFEQDAIDQSLRIAEEVGKG